VFARGVIVSVEKFLKQRAVTIAVDGNYTLHRRYDPEGRLRTLDCRTTRVSPFRMIVEVPLVGRIGDRLTSYFGAFGAFEGSISDTMHGSFLLELEMTRAQRERMSEQPIWLEKKQGDPTLPDERGDARSVPRTSHSTLTLADGSIHGCFIIDISVSGAAVSAELEPAIGTPLAVGACVSSCGPNQDQPAQHRLRPSCTRPVLHEGTALRPALQIRPCPARPDDGN
jgi:hypothetical protein